MVAARPVDRNIEYRAALETLLWWLATDLDGWQMLHVSRLPDLIIAPECEALENAHWIETSSGYKKWFRLANAGRGHVEGMASAHSALKLDQRVRVEQALRERANRDMARTFLGVGILERIVTSAGNLGFDALREPEVYDVFRNLFHDTWRCPPRLCFNFGSSTYSGNNYTHGAIIYGAALRECRRVAKESGLVYEAKRENTDKLQSLDEDPISVTFHDDIGQEAVLRPGAVIRHKEEVYTIGQQIGKGGTASVFLAVGQKSGRSVAAKCLHGERFPFSLRSRVAFSREIGWLKSISHTNVLQFVNDLWYGGEQVLLTELLSGGTLRDAIKVNQEMNEVQSRRIIMAVLRGVEAIHAKGLAHRDLTPKNVFLTDDARIAVVGDFGTVRMPDDVTLTHSHDQLGSLVYISADQFRSPHSATAADDVFSIGQMWWQLLTGQLPIGNPSPLRIARPDLSTDLVKIIESMRSPGREARPANAGEVLRRLARLRE